MLHILFQEIPSFEVGFGFAVELFIVIFSILCWLVTPEASTPSVTSKLEIVEQDADATLNCSDSLSFAEESLADFGKHHLGSINEVVESLSLKEARKVVSRLKDLKVISPDIKLSSKGIGKDFLIALVKGKVFQWRETIASTLTEVLGRTIA
ncbi:hypothetical protein [Tolypothrix sp. VBCCA 56010]|uniref:hypothetical protein n=1 Tax=Tolypothrix sp. VBCCA 56010 TaxID=3137731 RepID=UPI003D7D2A95